MKISEAIEKLTVKRDDALHFQKLYRAGDVGWSANESKAIAYSTAINTLQQIDEPQDEKVEVTEEQAELLKNCEGKSLFYLLGECSEDEEDLLARARLNGYTVKPKRWVVKFVMIDAVRYFSKFNGCNDLDYNYVGRKENAHIFTDKFKAEAVATLVEGSVEEV